MLSGLFLRFQKICRRNETDLDLYPLPRLPAYVSTVSTTFLTALLPPSGWNMFRVKGGPWNCPGFF
jgi:hypothetical protein